MASTVTYEHPQLTFAGSSYIAGGTTGLPAGWGGNAVTATVAMLDTDTSATIQHGFSLSQSELNALWPQIGIYQAATNGSAVGLSVGLGTTYNSSNSFLITKASLTGSGGTWVVQAFRPYSVNK